MNGNNFLAQGSRCLLGVATFAAILEGDAVAEQNLAPTPPLVLPGEVGARFWVYGQINKGVLVYSDGDNTDTYPLVDNANSSTRAGLWLKQKVTEDLTFSANVEAQWTPYSSFGVNQLTDGDIDWRAHQLRKGEAIVDMSDLGKIWLGQGAMASDGSAEADLSGTSVIAYSSVSDSAGGQVFAFSDGGLSTVSVGSAFKNYDGLGRLLRARYDTPMFHGFGLRTSVGKNAINGSDQVEWDVAGTFEQNFDSVEVRAGLAYSQPSGDRDRISGSVSALHGPTGLNLTFAAASDDQSDGSDGSYLYGKLGWRADLVSLGKTSFSADYFSGDDIATGGSESTTRSLAVVQSVPAWRTDFYATLRWYDYDDGAGYENGVAVLIGARFGF